VQGHDPLASSTEGERAEKEGVDQAEHGGVRADAQGEEQRRHGEAGRVPASQQTGPEQVSNMAKPRASSAPIPVPAGKPRATWNQRMDGLHSGIRATARGTPATSEQPSSTRTEGSEVSARSGSRRRPLRLEEGNLSSARA
jgi:hypothetical protein